MVLGNWESCIFQFSSYLTWHLKSGLWADIKETKKCNHYYIIKCQRAAWLKCEREKTLKELVSSCADKKHSDRRGEQSNSFSFCCPIPCLGWDQNNLGSELNYAGLMIFSGRKKFCSGNLWTECKYCSCVFFYFILSFNGVFIFPLVVWLEFYFNM